MSRRRLMVWVVILMMVGGAWLLSSLLDQRHQDEEDRTSRLWDLEDASSVLSLEYTGRDYPQPLRLERQEAGQPGATWRVTQPLNCPVDDLAVRQVLNALVRAKVSGRLEHPGSLADFGLAPPHVQLTLSDRQSIAYRLLVGEVSPSGESVYLARPDWPEVILAPAALRATLAKSLLDLRDKVVLDFPLDQVRRVELKNGPQALVLDRPGAEPAWTLEGQGPADPQAVDNLLLQAHGLMAQGFLDQGFKPAKLGLEPPLGSLTLTLADGSRRGLHWGKAVTGKNQIYTRRVEGGSLLLVQDESLRRLVHQPGDLVDRRCFTLEPSAVRQISIVGPGQKLVYARQDSQWYRLEGGQQGQVSPSSERLIWDLLKLRWEKPLPPGDYGLDTSTASITLEGGGTSQTLEVGRRDRQSGLAAARSTGQNAVVGIKFNMLSRIFQEPGSTGPGSQGQANQ